MGFAIAPLKDMKMLEKMSRQGWHLEGMSGILYRLEKGECHEYIYDYNMEEKKDNFYFVASIGDPDDEEFHIPIDITITPQKEVKLKKFVDTESGSQSEGMNVDPDTEGGV